LRNPTETVYPPNSKQNPNLSRLSLVVVVNKISPQRTNKKVSLQSKTSQQPLTEVKYTSQNRKAYILKQLHVLSTTRPDGQTSILKKSLMKNPSL